MGACTRLRVDAGKLAEQIVGGADILLQRAFAPVIAPVSAPAAFWNALATVWASESTVCCCAALVGLAARALTSWKNWLIGD